MSSLLAKQITGKGEQRNRNKNRHLGKTIELDVNCRQIDTGTMKSEQCGRGDNDEQRSAEQCQDDEQNTGENHGSPGAAGTSCASTPVRKRNAMMPKATGMISSHIQAGTDANAIA